MVREPISGKSVE